MSCTNQNPREFIESQSQSFNIPAGTSAGSFWELETAVADGRGSPRVRRSFGYDWLLKKLNEFNWSIQNSNECDWVLKGTETRGQLHPEGNKCARAVFR